MYLLDDMFTKLTRIRILYEEITCVYGKAHVTVVLIMLHVILVKVTNGQTLDIT
jgi:hypothetical protein